MNQHNRKAAVPATSLAGTVVSTSPAPHPFRLAIAQVLVLVVQAIAEQYRRRVFLPLAAAKRAARRVGAKGHDAHEILCRFVPVADPQPAGGDAL